MKTCKRDGCEKDVLRAGRALYCSDACRAKVGDKTYFLSHKEEINKRRRLKYKDNPKARLAGNRKYREANKEKVNGHISVYYKQYPEKRREKNRRRRSLKLGVTHESYHNSYIFERDEWTCRICGRKINKRLKYPNLLSASIDHIVPLSKGGDDSPVNIQASHLRCNLGKHAQNKGQLRLFG